MVALRRCRRGKTGNAQGEDQRESSETIVLHFHPTDVVALKLRRRFQVPIHFSEVRAASDRLNHTTRTSSLALSRRAAS
jgi:hypothetical protein